MSVNAIAYSHLIRALMDGAWNRNELSKITGLHSQTIGVHIRALHRRGVVYIAGWTQNEINKNWVPRFTFNRHGAVDVPLPFSLTTEEAKDLHQRAQAAFNTVEFLTANGMQVPTVTAADKKEAHAQFFESPPNSMACFMPA